MQRLIINRSNILYYMPDEWRRPTCISLAPATVERIDSERGEVPRSRWIEKAILSRLANCMEFE